MYAIVIIIFSLLGSEQADEAIARAEKNAEEEKIRKLKERTAKSNRERDAARKEGKWEQIFLDAYRDPQMERRIASNKGWINADFMVAYNAFCDASFTYDEEGKCDCGTEEKRKAAAAEGMKFMPMEDVYLAINGKTRFLKTTDFSFANSGAEGLKYEKQWEIKYYQYRFLNVMVATHSHTGNFDADFEANIIFLDVNGYCHRLENLKKDNRWHAPGYFVWMGDVPYLNWYYSE
jgi:hypothetical protein